ncbi:50S ribosomal protein L32 [Candidatus Uhrbacteria bacterium CG_4_9_14_0_2_um_filter_41_50]|uniref:Large ribosomal subunit protein bL32 n=1 Tax=Candidatus Uhrbacteria bacterium CG_4_9_14_0_2_um_filter_41_50 TaxID=1975031 RepID=A0A2M8EQ35_9BACT|nr:MAG: 50S ribosomal protein L32 [Candidatus Uhrbacteria bacterium CG_4_10_14_3_um_filter_41_21]PIZ54427.1 MAG: 50S ribosomal protein L32 [Candidatus Uhrbacteria bacterium CG_4_10_14_0_2_um_filter_41_21]PJB85038.1 MAG: 50S ribosomal protein L32 [Candidatus Uhrbacteria bacterium CG_4_9_14_0_8_um_filter_41_16]PJC24811.1 MAG: 50S ribosomal protein L32 [Candidatus Uhrbacteria bacterium CG_4_9_14_0_2_um_filter_41_50]PJE74938.1 MAG: 50S ribosomal protein L32 [Candidatus Uhrbacteria bacterium CG10_bi
MSVPAFRNSRSRVRRRRSHHALTKTAVAECPKCSDPILPHHACKSCGSYRGRQVKGGMEAVEKTLAKKPTKKAKTVKADA